MTIGNCGRIGAVRRALLRSTSVFGFCVISSAAAAQTIVGTAGDDLIQPGAVSVTLNSGATNNASGVLALAGGDTIKIFGPLNVAATSAGSLSDLPPFSIPLGNDALFVRAIATGVDSGTGADVLNLIGAAATSANASGHLDNFLVSNPSLLPTYGLANLSTDVVSKAVGAFGGGGFDALKASQSLNVSAFSISTRDNFSANPSMTDLDASISSISSAFGLDAGGGGGDMRNLAALNVVAQSVATSTTVTGGNLNLALGDLGISSQAAAFGFRAAAGDDVIAIRGPADVSAIAYGSTASAVYSQVNANFLAVGVDAVADAFGVVTGSGADSIAIANAATVSSQATAASAGVSVSPTLVSDADADLSALSTATGVDAGDDNDNISILSGASLSVFSLANENADAFQYSWVDTSSVPAGAESDFKLVQNEPLAAPDATTYGVRSGDGDDIFSNDGDLTARASSLASNLSVSIGGPAMPEFRGLFDGAPQIETGAASFALSIGADAGIGDDVILSTNYFVVSAFADSQFQLASAANPFAPEIPLASLLNVQNIIGGRTEARADAFGAIGDAGRDSILIGGIFDIRSTAAASILNINIDLAVSGSSAGSAFDIAGTLIDSAATASAFTIGVDGGTGGDNLTIASGATAIVRAAADAQATTVDAGIGVATAALPQVSLTGALIRNNISSFATAFGVSGNSGADQIEIAGGLATEAISTANSTSVSADVSFAPVSFTGSGVLLRGDVRSNADATGVTGGNGVDSFSIYDGGSVSSIASSNAAQNTVAVTVGAASNAGVSAQVFSVNTDARAVSNSTGLLADASDSAINIAGNIHSGAHSSARSLAVSADVDLVANGGSVDVGFVSAILKSDSFANGVSAFGSDTPVISTGVISSVSTASTSSQSVAASVSATGTGSSFNAALVQGAQVARARGAAISSGLNAPYVLNSGSIDALANAQTSIKSVTAGLSLISTGLTFDASVLDAQALSIADIAGIEALNGDAVVINNGAVNSHAAAGSVASSGAFTVSVTGAGATGALSLATTGQDVIASSRGISFGGGADYFANRDPNSLLSVSADASVQTNNTNVSAGLGGAGVSIGASAVDAAQYADAKAYGADMGAGDDRARNNGQVIVRADAGSVRTSTAVAVNGVSVGLAGNFSAVDARGVSDAASFGIDGGAGADFLVNAGDLSSISTAESRGGAVNVSAALSLTGIGVSASLVDLSSIATSSAFGFIGGGESDLSRNQLYNTGNLFVKSAAVAEANAVNLPALLGVALTDASAHASASASGLSGGGGGDEVVQYGALDVYARSTARAATTQVSLAGVDLGEADATSIATAAGIDAGGGNDSIDVGGATSVNALATLSAASQSAAGAGYAAADVAALASASSKGVDAGTGHDTVTISAAVSSTAAARPHAAALEDGLLPVVGGATGTSQVAVALIGGAETDVSARFYAGAIGVDTGGGNDTVVVKAGAGVRATASAEAKNRAYAISGVGASLLDAAQEAYSSAVGVALGDGADSIRIAGTVFTNSDVVFNGYTFSLNLGGASLGAEDVLAVARSSAILADSTVAGDDIIRVLAGGAVDARAIASTSTSAITLNLLGAAAGGGAFNLLSDVLTIDAGDGTDAVLIDGGLVADATTVLSGSSFTLSGVGYAGVDSTLGANSAARGALLGDGNDYLRAGGSFHVSSYANASPTSMNISGIGFASSGVSTGSHVIALGADGGAGDDYLGFTGTGFSVGSTALSTYRSSSINLLGAQVNGLFGGADAASFGLSGGVGADAIEFNGAGFATVSATANSNINSTTFQGAGATINRAGVAATSASTLVDGGSGGDAILIAGQVSSSARSNVTAGSSAKVLIGASSAVDGTRAVSSAFGVDGGTGDDRVQSTASLSVQATSDSTVTGTNYVYVGAAKYDAFSTALSFAVGLEGGNGANSIDNFGDITVFSRAGVDSSGASSGFGFSNASRTSAKTNAFASATGIRTGNGDDAIYNGGDIVVSAHPYSFISNSASAGGAWVNAITDGHVFGGASVIGIDAGRGADVIRSDGLIDIDIYTAAALDRRVRIETFSTNPGAVNFSPSGNARATASFNGTTAYGIYSEGSVQASNRGEINILVNPDVTAVAIADANGVFAASGSARTVIGVSDTEVAGMKFGDLGADVKNFGLIDVTLATRTGTFSGADSDGLGSIANGDPDAISFTSVNMNRNVAAGIITGAGADVIRNLGDIKVRNTIRINDAVAHSERGSGIEGIDTFATADAIMLDNIGYGIFAGDGDNVVVNSGLIDVDVAPYARAVTESYAAGLDGDAEARPTARIRGAYGYGIRTGAGQDTIVNNGVIDVYVNPKALASIFTTVGTGGSRKRVPVEETTSIFSFGIASGDGDDYVVNNGTIAASRSRGSGNIIAISTEGGNDVVELTPGSITGPHMLLGAGDDRIIFHSGATFTGSMDGQSGFDVIELVGAGVFAHTLIGIEGVAKSGAGQFTATTGAGWSSIDISRGSLSLAGLPSSTADFSTFIDGDGSAGLLALTSPSAYSFNGDLVVTAGQSAFSNGQRFTVLTANGFSFNPASVTLPSPTATLDFATASDPAKLEIIVTARSFASASITRNQASLGAALDAALPTATGDFNLMLGAIQRIETVEGVRLAYDALIPTIASQPLDRRMAKGLDTVVRERISSSFFGANETPLELSGVVGETADSADGETSVWVGDLGFAASGDDGSNSLRVAGGAEFRPSASLMLGFGASANLRPIAANDGLVMLDAPEAQFSVFAAKSFGGGLFASATAMAGKVSTFGRRGRSLFDERDDFALAPARRLAADLELGKGVQWGDSLRGEFYGAARTISEERAGVKEARAGNLNQTVSFASEAAAEAALGARAAFSGGGRSFAWRGRVGVEFSTDLQRSEGGYMVRFADAPDHAFRVTGDEIGSNAARLNAAVDVANDKGGQVRFAIDAEARENANDIAAKIELKQSF